MKKALLTLFALAFSVVSYAQLIANKTDNKVTLGFDLFSDFQLAKANNSKWDARGFNQGVSLALTYNFPMGESSKHTVAVGLGMSSHNYYCYNRLINPYTNDTMLFSESYRGNDKFKRAKINPTYIEVPLELRFRIKDQLKIGVGFKFGLMVAAKSKYVGPDYTDDETLSDGSGVTIHEKDLYINNLERYAYSATLRVGWRWVSVFAAYQISPVFAVGHEAPEIHPLSVGFSFAPF